jgi:hypothetical protein
VEEGDVRTDRELDDQFAVVSGVVIVLREALSDLASGDANDGVGVGVVGGGPPEDFNSDASLLEVGSVPAESLFDDVGKESGITLAVGEERVSDKPLELGTNLGGIRRRELFQLLG